MILRALRVGLIVLPVGPGLWVVAQTSQASTPQVHRYIQERVDVGQSFNPALQSPIVADNGQTRLSTEYKNERLYLKSKRGNADVQVIPLPSDLAQATQVLFAPNNRAVIVGMYSGDISEVAIVDLGTQVSIDHFFCYSPAPSPNGRYIAFVKVYPPHGENVEDQYMIYDVEADPSHNRLAGVSPDDPRDAGLPVFPFSESGEARNNLRIPDSEAHRMSASTFFWDSDSSSYLFADHYQHEVSLIVAKVGNDDQISIATITAADLGACPSGNTILDSCWVRLVAVEFLPAPTPDQIKLTFQGMWTNVGYKKTVTLDALRLAFVKRQNVR